jgi:tRNA pseudouridine38-40 synthase
MPRYALLLAYDGTGFAGWWRQPGRRTVAGELDAAFLRLGEPAAAPVGASRTDAGVHALAQTAHADLARAWDPAALAAALDAQLPEDLCCRAAARVAEGWHAVHGVLRKTYRYRIWTGPGRDPFLAARLAWRPPWPLDARRLAACARAAPGERDWAAFVRRGERRGDTRCRLLACSWRRQGPLLVCTLAADGFIYRLARSLVGGMAAVARGAADAAEWRAALAGTPGRASTQQAPALGLRLEAVRYAEPPAWASARRS